MLVFRGVIVFMTHNVRNIDSECACFYASDPEFMKRIVTVNVEMKWKAGLTKTNDVNNINH